MPISTRIFISYGRDDDEPFVRRLYHDLVAHGYDVWWDRVDMPNRGLTFLQEIRDAILERERLLLVVGPDAMNSDYVGAEWRCALQACGVVTPVLRLGEYDLLPEELSRLHCVDMRPARPYPEALAELLRILDEPVAPLCQLFNVPSLPGSFLPRPSDLAALEALILADVNQPTVITSAKQTALLQGMGGVGKSVLAAAFARSCQARRAFRDGIAWLQIGQEPDPLTQARALAGAMGGDPREYFELESAFGLLGVLLKDKSCLLVLDDVWDIRHAERFKNALGPGGRLLITTRDGGLASALSAALHRLDVLPEAEALELLARYALILPQDGEPVRLPETARQVAQECGRLPFALALCGAMHADRVSWEDMMAALQEADLSFIEKQLPGYPFPDILKCIKVSLDMLGRENPAFEKHYRELAVFAKGAPLPEAAVIQLWVHTDGLNERGARKLLATLERKALLRLEGEEPHRRVTLHDLHHDYLLAVLHDLGGLHNELLAAYKEKCPQRWADGPDDGYFFQSLPYHLAQAGRQDELKSTLFDYRWLYHKLHAEEANAGALVSDYDLLSPLPAGEGSGVRAGAQSLQIALRQAIHVLAQDPDQLPSQLWGRLCDRDEPELKSLLQGAIQEHPKPWLRPTTPSLAEDEALVRTFAGHTEGVSACAVTPDGRQVISASSDCTLMLWDLASGAFLRTFEGHTDGVVACTVTPDGRQVVSASWDNTLKLWDLASGACLRTFEGHIWHVKAFTLTPDGRYAVSASWDNTLKLWELASGACLRTFEGHTGGVNACAVTPDGRQVVSASHDHTLKLWDLASGACLLTFVGHTSHVSACALTPDGRQAVSASHDHTLKLWDLASGACLRTFEGHTDSVYACAVTLDGRYAVSASSYNTLKLWDLASGSCLRTFEGHSDWVFAFVLTPDERQVISASEGNSLKLWDISPALDTGLASGAFLRTFEGHTGRVVACTVTPDGRQVVSASYDKTLKLWDLASGACLRTFEGHTDHVNACAVTPDGRYAVSASYDHTLKLWDLASGACLRTFEGHTSMVDACALTPDGRQVVSASDADRTLKLWELASGACLRTFKGYTGYVSAFALTPDGRRVVSASSDKTLKLWDLASGACLLTFVGHTSHVSACALTPDGRQVVSASWDHTLKLWDLASGACLRTFEGHTHDVLACALTPDGRQVVSASWDHTLKLWDLASGAALCTFEGHTNIVTACALTPDGRQVVSASLDDGNLRLWELETGEVLITFVVDGVLETCTFTPDGHTIVCGSASGRLYILCLEGMPSSHSAQHTHAPRITA